LSLLHLTRNVQLSLHYCLWYFCPSSVCFDPVYLSFFFQFSLSESYAPLSLGNLWFSVFEFEFEFLV
jgi:hypothetical protein